MPPPSKRRAAAPRITTSARLREELKATGKVAAAADDEGAESDYSGLGSTDDEATGPVIIKAATVEAEAKPGQETSKRKALGQSIYFCK